MSYAKDGSLLLHKADQKEEIKKWPPERVENKPCPK